MSRKRKIIILGGKGYQLETKDLLVKCFLWSEIQKIKNIRDYDIVIINLLSEPKKLDSKLLFEHLNIESALGITQNGGVMIVVGDPRFEIETIDQENKEKKKYPFLWWTGVKFHWDDSPGDTVNFEDDYLHRKYADYISHLSKWDYSLSDCSLNKKQLMQMFDESIFEKHGWSLDLEFDRFCHNRYRNALAFSVRTGIFTKYKDQKPFYYGPIIFLPKIDKNEDETIQIILRDLCDVETELPEPNWLTDYVAPGQSKIDKEIEEITLDLETTFQDLRRAEEEREKIRTCLKLLYEREYALEPATRSILRALGAHIEDPSERGKEDGWIVVAIERKKYEGVLEIKSTKSDQFSENGIRQLLDWIQRGISLRKKKYKGIFIGNSAVDKPLNERPWAFSDSWQKSAELNDICAMKTEDLYFIYVLKKEGKIDVNTFWKAVFENNGILNIKEFLPEQENLSNKED
jgi:hypothetical protein